MSIIEKLEDFPCSSQTPIVLTIGNFDGMHRGHCAVLKHAHHLAHPQGTLVVLTFSNHPSEILRPQQPTLLINSLSHKLHLLQHFDVDHLILLPFTRYLAQHSAEFFIENIRQFIPFTHLVLGHDATLGRDRQGDPITMKTLGMEWGFHVYHLEEYRYEGKPVSSTHIRQALQQGNLIRVEELLNRPYSIYGPVIQGYGKGKTLGFPTANLDVSGLCRPPMGVYVVEVKQNDKCMQGIANLGFAPTFNQNSRPILEVHLFEMEQDFVGDSIEVIFKHFIRPEYVFANADALIQQINQDIKIAKEYQSAGH